MPEIRVRVRVREAGAWDRRKHDLTNIFHRDFVNLDLFLVLRCERLSPDSACAVIGVYPPAHNG
jgi:hypothetical protein